MSFKWIFSGVPIRARDILGDLKLKESVKAYT